MRVVLGTAALLVVLIEQGKPLHIPIYLTLVLYSLYGLLIYHLSVRRNPIVAHKIIPWLDALWYVPLIYFSSHTSNLFYYFFFFRPRLFSIK